MAAQLSPTLIRTLAAAFLGVSSLAAIAGIVTNSFHFGSGGSGSSDGSASGGYASAVRPSGRPLVVDAGSMRTIGAARGDTGGSFLGGSGMVSAFGGDRNFQFDGGRAKSWSNALDWNNHFDDRSFVNTARGSGDAPPWAPPSLPSGFGGWGGDHANGSAPGWDPQWWIWFGDHSPQQPPIPEPQVVSLLVLGSAMIGFAVRRRRRSA